MIEANPAVQPTAHSHGRLGGLTVVWAAGGAQRDARAAAIETLYNNGFTVLNLDKLIELEVDAATGLGRQCTDMLLTGQIVPLQVRLSVKLQ